MYSIQVEVFENVASETTCDIFSEIEQQPWSFLLDSSAQQNHGGRYDIVTTDPCLTYQFTKTKHLLAGPWASQLNSNAIPKWQLMHACPYKNLNDLQAAFNQHFDTQAIEQLQIPFVCGAMGVFGYDGNITSDNIKDGKPMQYQLPDISVGFYTSSIVYDNVEKTLFICSAQTEKLCDLKSLVLHKIRGQSASIKSQTNQEFWLQNDWQANMSYAEYQSKFQQIKEFLAAGDCYQVNFAQRFSAYYKGNEWNAYVSLRTANKAPFSAFVRLPRSTIMSLSPERFLLSKNGNVQSKPIKGTRTRDPNPVIDKQLADSLLNAQKDKAENLMIVDLLRNDLSKHCQAHSVKVPSLFALESYPAVHHMVSTVTGKLKPQSGIYDLIQGAFPGGSITGAPKIRAMQIIQSLEPDKRSVYCGSIVYVGVRNDMDSNICIRTLLAENNQIHCWAGGGIVIDSEGDDEYQESLHKVAKILPRLKIKKQKNENAINTSN